MIFSPECFKIDYGFLFFNFSEWSNIGFVFGSYFFEYPVWDFQNGLLWFTPLEREFQNDYFINNITIYKITKIQGVQICWLVFG